MLRTTPTNSRNGMKEPSLIRVGCWHLCKLLQAPVAPLSYEGSCLAKYISNTTNFSLKEVVLCLGLHFGSYEGGL